MADRPEVTEQTPLLQRRGAELSTRTLSATTRKATTLGYLLLLGFLILLSLVAYDIRTPLPPALSDTAAMKANDFAGQHAYDEYLTKLTEPHSVNSRGNIIVKDWLVTLAREFQAEAEKNEIEVDIVANDSTRAIFKQNWFADNEHLFAESRNVMVRIHGSKANVEEALLINAHYDSVPTSHGVTDDGMGVAVELELLRYFVKHPPQNTIIFLFNNFEEGGLVGAKHFVNHPWFPTVKLFFNLEGAGAGGRAILFRCSSLETAQLLAKHAPLVHSTPLGNDMLKLGLLKSDTDYTILEKHGVPGLDIAFYYPRSHYHTPRDTLQYTSPKAVQHMGQMILAAVRAVDQSDGILSQEHERKMVNFDILGRIMFAHGFTAVNIVNMLSLISIPLIGAVWTFFASGKNIKADTRRTGLVVYGLVATLAALICSILFVAAAAAIMLKINPKVTYGNAYAVGLCIFVAAIAGINFSQWACSLIKPVREKLSIPETDLYGVTALWWFLVVAAAVLGFKQIGVLYYTIFGFLGNAIGTILYHGISKDSKLRLPLTLLAQLVVPILVLVDYTFLTMDSMRHATVDGTPEAAVYALESVTIVLAALQLLPWMNRIGNRGYLTTLSISVFVVLLAICAVLPPFTTGWSPNKLIFRQEYNATEPLSSVSMIGAAGLPSSLYPALTDEEAKSIKCEPFNKYQTICTYKTDKLPLYAQKEDEMKIDILSKECKGDVCRVDVSMVAQNSLLCSVRFDTPGYTSDHIIKARVDGLETEEGARIGSLLTYSSNYGDQVQWGIEYYSNNATTTHAVVGCFYDEWSKGEIPAFTHLLDKIHKDTTLLLRGQGLAFVNFAHLDL